MAFRRYNQRRSYTRYAPRPPSRRRYGARRSYTGRRSYGNRNRYGGYGMRTTRRFYYGGRHY